MKKILLAMIRFYQRHISPCFPARCRFTPTCSQYAWEAITKYGALKGTGLAIGHLADPPLQPLLQGGLRPRSLRWAQVIKESYIDQFLLPHPLAAGRHAVAV